MTPAEAAKIFELPAGATSEQIETRFLELRRKLEDKIAKAPTPGLQAKYRESLTEITTAFETLTLAADSSALPVTRKQGASNSAVGSPLAAGPAAASPRSKRPVPSSTRKSGREFLLVAIVAVLVLAGGGWFVLKTRTENTEKARIAAEAKAENARIEAAAATEKDRLEKLTVSLRSTLAELRVTWDGLERAERAAERALSERKSELRSARDLPAGKRAEKEATVAAHQDYYEWIKRHHADHPARMLRAKADELVSARAADDAAPVVEQLRAALAPLRADLERERSERLAIDGSVSLNVSPEDSTWKLTDAFGREASGSGNARIPVVARGAVILMIDQRDYKLQTLHGTVVARQELRLSAVLEKAVYPQPGQIWENTLGQKFVPVPGTSVLFSIWETRAGDYITFAHSTGGWGVGILNSWPAHPVRNVTWDDAQEFCQWLTQKERRAKKLGSNQSYRLPTDAEWSIAVGLTNEGSGSPGDKHAKVKGQYPWGTQWPPPRGTGNFAQSLNVDAFEYTAPVGSFSANQHGVYDLGGNVWEWVEDQYSSSNSNRVLRGGRSLTAFPKSCCRPTATTATGPTFAPPTSVSVWSWWSGRPRAKAVFG